MFAQKKCFNTGISNSNIQKMLKKGENIFIDKYYRNKLSNKLPKNYCLSKDLQKIY